MRTRYDVIINFGLDITDHFYAGDNLIGGLTYENLKNLFSEGQLARNDFFPELITQLNSLFGDKYYMTTCTINDEEFSVYFRCETTEVEKFEKNIFGWVILNDLDSCFHNYCLIDYDNKLFKIMDSNGVVTTDKLRGFTLVMDEDDTN